MNIVHNKNLNTKDKMDLLVQAGLITPAVAKSVVSLEGAELSQQTYNSSIDSMVTSKVIAHEIGEALKLHYASQTPNSINSLSETAAITAAEPVASPTSVSGRTRQQFDEAIKAGWVIQDGDFYVSKVEFENGILKVNDKAMALAPKADVVIPVMDKPVTVAPTTIKPAIIESQTGQPPTTISKPPKLPTHSAPIVGPMPSGSSVTVAPGASPTAATPVSNTEGMSSSGPTSQVPIQTSAPAPVASPNATTPPITSEVMSSDAPSSLTPSLDAARQKITP